MISTLDLRPLILRRLAGCKAHLFQYNPNFVKWAQGGQKGMRLQPLELQRLKKVAGERETVEGGGNWELGKS